MSEYDELYRRFKRFVQQQGKKITDDDIADKMIDEYLQRVNTLGAENAWKRADYIKRRLQREREKRRR